MVLLRKKKILSCRPREQFIGLYKLMVQGGGRDQKSSTCPWRKMLLLLDKQRSRHAPGTHFYSISCVAHGSSSYTFLSIIPEIPSIEQIRTFCPETFPLNESLTFCGINQPAQIIFCFTSVQLTLTDATWIHFLKWIYCCQTAGRKCSTMYSDVTQNEVKSTVCDHSSNRWLACEVFVVSDWLL